MSANTIRCAAAILATLFLQSAAFADQQPYVIKQTIASVGSSIKRPIIVTGMIPLDQKYSELTPEQKNLLKSVYEKMGDNDEPPFPARGLRPLYTGLGMAYEKLELAFRGPLTMYVAVDSQGVPGAMEIVESPDPQITQALANIMATQKFKPAVCNGSPCAMRYVFHAELVGPDEHNMHSANPSSGVQVSKTSGY